jgi:hypothetical protein
MAGIKTRFAASVPLETKVTPRGETAASAATASRACSTIARASRPSWWIEEGLPTRSNAAAQASRASARKGAVALKSR